MLVRYYGILQGRWQEGGRMRAGRQGTKVRYEVDVDEDGVVGKGCS